MNYIRAFVEAELASSNPLLKLDDRRLAKLLSAVKTPNHPPYALMIRSAMEKMNNGGESSEQAISEFIVREFEGLPLAHEGILKHHLGKLCDNGEIRLSDDELYVSVTDCSVGEGDAGEGNRSAEQTVEQEDTEAIEAQIQKAPTNSAPALQRRKLRCHDRVDPVLAVSVFEQPFLKQCETSQLSQRRKLRSHHKESTVLDSVSKPKNEPQQRGRGRPPKPNTETALSLAPKRRGRGRPPKPKPDFDAAIVVFKPSKGKRGRPRKVK